MVVAMKRAGPPTPEEARRALFGMRDGLLAHPHYSALLYEGHEDVRARLVREWIRFAEFADSQFLAELRRDPHARLWEMRVGSLLMDAGMRLDSSDSGPDLQVTNLGRKAWVECVASTAGVGENEVDEPPVGEVFLDNEAPRLLRWTASIVAKHKKWADKYVPGGYVGADDAHVVALNSGRVPSAGTMDLKRLPWIVRMLYGLGQDFVTFRSDGTTRDGVRHRFRIKNSNGAAITTALFVDPQFASTSGVLFASGDTFNTEQGWARPVFVHNPNAHAPLEVGWLQRGAQAFREFYVNDDRHIVETGDSA